MISHLLNFLYPPCCLHCDALIDEKKAFLCPSCFSLLSLINPIRRCNSCFNDGLLDGQLICQICEKNPPPWEFGASAFDYEGPAASLIIAMKYGNCSYLAKGLSGFMAAQFLSLNWPLPDLLIPVPVSFSRFMERGYNQSYLLAKGLGKILGKPVRNVLTRRSGDYSQAALPFKEREQLSHIAFSLKKTKALQGKRILLIDDVITTTSTLRACSEALLEGLPGEIYALTLCRSVC